MRFTIRQLLAVMLVLSLLLAIAVPFGWLGALLLGVSLPVATYIGTGTLLAFRMSRVTSLALTVFATCLAVMFASRFASVALEQRVHPQVFLLATMAAATIVWLLLVYLTKDRPAGDRPQEALNPAGAEPSTSSSTNGANIGEPDGVC
jgi:hypothetical protein